MRDECEHGQLRRKCPFCEWAQDEAEYERRIAELEAENERLENLLAEGVHSCSRTCKRPMCVLRREKADLEQQLSTLEERIIAAMKVYEDRVEQVEDFANKTATDIYEALKGQSNGT